MGSEVQPVDHQEQVVPAVLVQCGLEPVEHMQVVVVGLDSR
jgi:hypothetical protein